MAEELLRAKQDFKELGKNWSEKFLNRHPALQSKYDDGSGITEQYANPKGLVTLDIKVLKYPAPKRATHRLNTASEQQY